MKIHQTSRFIKQKPTTRPNTYQIKSRPTSKNDKSSDKTYMRYQCEYKKKAIMNKLQSDSGYPQQLISSFASNPKKQENNYLLQNTKNLKNFFKERIPMQNTLLNKLLKRQGDMIDPRRIFQMKKIEYQLKNSNKINLKKEFSLEIQKISNKNIDKMKSSFHINQKNINVKSVKGKNMYLSFYDDNNHRKGTQSYIGKRSKILKKQAYDKVFGPDISSLSGTLNLIRPFTADIKLDSPKINSASLHSTIKTSPNKNLRQLIYKMNDYKNKLQDKEAECILPTFDEYEQKQQQSTIISKIKQITQLYKTKNINQGYSNIQHLEDIQILNKEYYKQLINHKKNRLNKRNLMISQNINYEGQKQPFVSYKSQFSNHNRDGIQYNDNSCQRKNQHSVISIRDVDDALNDEPKGNQSVRRHTAASRYALLRKTLVRWAAMSYIYGISRKNIFLVFRPKEISYLLQGSYAFFKFIKNGNLQSVKKFTQKNSIFIFQVEYYGKTTLSYACLYSQVQVGKFILSFGVNCDQLCHNGKTSLYYAVKSNCIQLAQAILRKGASPWSTRNNNYKKILDEMNDPHEGFKILFNNAKKIYIGMQMQYTIRQRSQFWQKHKDKINYQTMFTYQNLFL